MNSFLFVCIPARLLLAYAGYALPADRLRQLSLLTTIIGLGFLIIYFFDLRSNGHIGPEGRIWWNTVRPIHALYLLSVYAYRGSQYAYLFLLADAMPADIPPKQRQILVPFFCQVMHNSAPVVFRAALPMSLDISLSFIRSIFTASSTRGFRTTITPLVCLARWGLRMRVWQFDRWLAIPIQKTQGFHLYQQTSACMRYYSTFRFHRRRVLQL